MRYLVNKMDKLLFLYFSERGRQKHSEYLKRQKGWLVLYQWEEENGRGEKRYFCKYKEIARA